MNVLKHLLLLVLYCATALPSQAAKVSVSGTIYIGQNGDPLPEYEVSAGYAYRGEIKKQQTLTDDNGQYRFEIEYPNDVDSLLFLQISTFDFCMGLEIVHTIPIAPDAIEVSFEKQDLVTCQSIVLPNDPTYCRAFFYYQPTAEDSLTIQFEDLSFSLEAITAWKWDFGDGHYSDQQNPKHKYSNKGLYLARLAIVADSCYSTFVLPVRAGLKNVCICTREYEPVCVYLGDDIKVSYNNRCLAECAGFTPDQIVSCADDTTCVCPLNYAPVCAVGPNGEVTSFPNECFAICAGFDKFFPCDTTTIECPDYDFPVCVVVNGDTLSFANPCKALVAGYTPDQFSDCSGLNNCLCTYEYAPVCVSLPDGSQTTFPNRCIAACYGYTDSTVVACPVDSIPYCPCPEYYDPVCVVVGTDTLQFDNPCFAKCEGFTNWFRCRINPGDCENYDSTFYQPVCVWIGGVIKQFPNVCMAIQQGFPPELYPYVACEDCICPAVYDPVWVVLDDGSLVQFSNECEARCKGFPPHRIFKGIEDCICPAVYDPVCFQLPDGIIVTVGNACEARCYGISNLPIVDCADTTHCFCPLIYDPVCVLNEAGDTLTFSNKCFATCEGYLPENFVDCPPIIDPGCICPDIWAPVCVKLDDGTILQFSNDCEAHCKGYQPWQLFKCNDDCICDAVYDPVCVAVDSFNVVTFSNVCRAICAGYDSTQFVTCLPDSSCICTKEYNPVCVTLSDGTVRTYPNPCFAACDGYGPNDYVFCNDQRKCVAGFSTAPVNREDPTLLYFFDHSESFSGEIVAWKWYFGDEQTSDQAKPVHQYAKEGVYQVTLYILTAGGCEDKVTMPVLVGDPDVSVPDCQAIFYFTQDSVHNATFQFHDLSIGDVQGRFWSFGDGTFSAESNPVHTFTSPGVYNVTLTVKTGNCESLMAALVFTNPDIVYDRQCSALFVPFIVPGTNQVFFLNLSSTDVQAYKWNFGDGTTSSEATPGHTYTTPGVYEISLTIETKTGCTNTYKVTIDFGQQDGFIAKAEYSIASKTKENRLKNLPVKLYPNPTAGLSTLEFDLQRPADVVVTLYTMDGRVIRSNQQSAGAGTLQVEVDLSNQPSGLYFAKVFAGDRAAVVKVIKE